jgi:hypothetical protein
MHHLTVLLFLFAAFTAAAQDAIIVPPLTQGERGTVVRITVSGTITQTGTSQVALTYPADVVRIIAIEGGEQYAYRCPSMPIYGTSVDAPSTGRLTFQCEEVVATGNGELFVVVAEFLRGPGTIGPMQVMQPLPVATSKHSVRRFNINRVKDLPATTLIHSPSALHLSFRWSGQERCTSSC